MKITMEITAAELVLLRTFAQDRIKECEELINVGQKTGNVGLREHHLERQNFWIRRVNSINGILHGDPEVVKHPEISQPT